MLENLHVKNFAIIEETELDFKSGLNILTGETGAGKSILIDAVSAVLGLRTGPEVIRKGADSAYVEIVFSVPEEDRKAELAALDISTEYDCIVISRKILPGRSIHKINDEIVTSAKARKATELLLDIHGQHEHQSLLKPAKHREILDSFIGSACRELKQKLAEAYKEWQQFQKEAASFEVPAEERIRRMDFLRFEIEEIEEAAVKPGEKEELTDLYRTMNHYDKIRTALIEVLSELGSDNPGGAGESVSRAIRQLSPVSTYTAELTSLHDELLTVEDLLHGAVSEAEAFLDSSDFSEERFRETENRLDTIHHLESKYGLPADRLEEALEQRRDELDSWERYEERKAASEAALQKAEDVLKRLSDELHALRVKTAPALEDIIRRSLTELNFLSVEFKISVVSGGTYSLEGADDIEFLVALNPGEDPAPLAKVASGGELSRIMLAIKTILADKDDIPTVIFDEVDTGISGRTAQMVGRKLKEISRYRQVILITHLPQIAALADTHFGIDKLTENGRTHTRVHLLSEEETVGELARLLGGMNNSAEVISAARQLRAQAKSGL